MTTCRLWSGPTNRDGYGRKYDKRTKCTVLLHRWVWERVNGPIPDGMVIMHTCDTPACYRYDHLQLGTQLDNIEDMRVKGRAVGGGGQRKGSAMPNAKLTESDVLAMRLAFASGKRIRDIAAQYGVGKSTAHRAIKGDSWPHV